MLIIGGITMADFILEHFKKEVTPTKLAQLVYLIVGSQLILFLDIGLTIVGFLGFVLVYVLCLGMIKLDFSLAMTNELMDDKIKKEFLFLFQDIFLIMNISSIFAIIALIFKRADFLTMAFNTDILIIMVTSFFYYILER